MLTPADLRSLKPRRAFRGYSRSAVNELFEHLASTLDEAEAGCAALRVREAALRRELEQGESLDRRMRETMITAQRDIDRMEAETKRESEALRERARIDALETEDEFEDEHEALAASFAEVRRIESELRAGTRALVERALSELSRAPGAVAVAAVDEAPAAVEQTQSIPVLPPPPRAEDVEPQAESEAIPAFTSAAATEEEEEDTRSFALAPPDDAEDLAVAHRPRRLPVLSFAILLAGTLIAIGIWQLSSADGASKANASAQLADATLPAPSTSPVETVPTAPSSSAEPEATPTAQPAEVVTPSKAELVITADAGDCWLQVRAGSAVGRLLYDGFLYQGDKERFTAKRLWVRLGNPGNVSATLAGKPIENLPPGTGDMVVTAGGVKVVSLG